MTLKKLLLVALPLTAVVASLGCFYWLTPGPDELRLPGVVETQEVRLSTKIGGRVCKVAVREGQIVSADQELVFLEAPELEARRDQTAASLAAAVAQLAKAEAGPRPAEKAAARAAVEAARAKFKRLQAGYRVEEVEIALGDWKALEADLDRAEKEWNRESRLLQVGSTTAAQGEVSWTTLCRLQAQTRVAHTRYKMLAAGNRVEDIAEAEAELARCQAQLDLLEEGTRTEEIAEARARVAELQAKAREIDAQLKEAVVRAASPALVETVAVRCGDVVSANQPVVRVLPAEELWVKVFVPETDLGKVRLGREVKVTCDSYPGRRFRGVVSHIASVSEFTPRNVATVDERHHQVFAVKVRLLESEQVFRSGMAADVFLPLALSPEQ
jgi:multidrug resistance efflux pump